MTFPIRAEPGSKYGRSFHKLLLLFDPWGHNLLLLDDLVHEVLGGVEERTTGGVVALNVLSFPASDISKLSARDGVLDALVGEGS